MPNHQEHQLWGTVAGLSYCLVTDSNQGQEISLPEMLGAAISSTATSKLPDLLEPAIHPNHRSTFHSLCFLLATALVALPWSEKKRQEQLQIAKNCWLRAQTSINEPESRQWQQQALWHEFVAGLYAGMVVGYISHLAADSLTPKGLPLL
jgi:hypothetical protein